MCDIHSAFDTLACSLTTRVDEVAPSLAATHPLTSPSIRQPPANRMFPDLGSCADQTVDPIWWFGFFCLAEHATS